MKLVICTNIECMGAIDLQFEHISSQSALTSGCSVTLRLSRTKMNITKTCPCNINSQKKDAQGIPPLKKRNGCDVAQSESEKAAEFNGQFTDVFTKSEYSQVSLLDRSAPLMEDIVVTKEGVTKRLKGLNPSKALWPGELHPRVLKELATELGPIFAHLFQQSIDSGDIPKEWTLANISPLFKKGDRSLACNYRPVSLTCVPCKLLEHIVCPNIMAHLDEHKLLVRQTTCIQEVT